MMQRESLVVSGRAGAVGLASGHMLVSTATCAVVAWLVSARQRRDERLVELGYEAGRQDGWRDAVSGEDRPAVLLELPRRRSEPVA